ncbi:isoleucine--tRNA ligase [Natronosporangium hydrolyticum]|uniref:isoleucine--tRNA ligase n=1 Tax=Natronosporangium hydrolyticum TaxID=2811111 RepID=UPI0023BB0689|nr:isoleucine--tRNA ligase [Natronosporangium hydrolyticum]
MYEPLEPGVDLPAMEQEVLAWWRAQDVFQRSLTQSADGPRWIFYEGPPTANGVPGIHHVEARAFKDAFPRYRTMKGYHVPRRAGWDCHGLPVELEVEKALGLSSKQEIEAFGIAEFNRRCRESVLTYVDSWVRMSERMGYWVDFDRAYRTMDATYVESLWWALKQIHDQGLLVEDHRVAPYCPRCQTALSSHELGQPGAYQDIVSPSAYVRFPVTEGAWADQAADLLVWTTTPWTLVSNTAVAVHPDVTYVLARHDDHERALIVAEPLLAAALGDGWRAVDQRPGRELTGLRYARPFELIDVPAAHYVVGADFVTTEDGTGLVHLAPAFGADDLAVGRSHNLPVVNPVGPDGKFVEQVPLVGGMLFKEADQPLLADLRERGLLFREAAYPHAYPHCWRCGHALLYYAMPSWYIRTTAIKDQLIAENERTNWHPGSIQHGRYGDWLSNNVDWALSRRRYWGTPLPIWRCGNDHVTCVGSLAELGSLTGHDLSDLDPHRPFVDEISFACPTCGETAQRVQDVIDVWFDSGAMPFAQLGAPLRNADEFAESYPAQFICEAIDQTRGWFYTLMAVGTLLYGRSSYENVVCVGLLLDAEGRKMSKRLGNILEPIPLMDRHGADAVRWFMLAAGSPWNDRRIGHEALSEIVRKVLLTFWNTAAFQTLYGRTAGWTPQAERPPVSQRPVLDRWLCSELAALVDEVDAAMAAFDSQRAARQLAEFIDHLSNWYVRRSRRRFWDGDPAALATLHDCLDTVTRLLAPLTPFIADRVWRALVAPTDPDAAESVHLARWPQSRPGDVDPQLSRQMRLVRQLVEVGRTARAASGVKVRQPLSRALIIAPGWAELPTELRAEIADELNVTALETLDDAATVVDITVRPQFRAIGKRFGNRTQPVAAAVRAADPAAVAAALQATGKVTITCEGEELTLGPDEIDVNRSPRSGWFVATEDNLTVALDLEITPELRRAGVARDVIRLVQQARKDTGLQITDRIRLRWSASGETAASIREHQDRIQAEVLAVTCTEAADPAAAPATVTDEQLGIEVWIEPTDQG